MARRRGGCHRQDEANRTDETAEKERETPRNRFCVCCPYLKIVTSPRDRYDRRCGRRVNGEGEPPTRPTERAKSNALRFLEARNGGRTGNSCRFVIQLEITHRRRWARIQDKSRYINYLPTVAETKTFRGRRSVRLVGCSLGSSDVSGLGQRTFLKLWHEQKESLY